MLSYSNLRLHRRRRSGPARGRAKRESSSVAPLQEALGCPTEPSEHEQRVLTAGPGVFRHSGEGGRPDGVIAASLVEVGREIPQLVGYLPPAQSERNPLGVERRVQRASV